MRKAKDILDVPKRYVSVLAVFLLLTLLATGDLLEIIPFFAPLVASPWFPFFHETHDLLALMVALYAAHKLSPAVGSAAVAWFIVVHVPYAYLVFQKELPELVRLIVLAIVALFGVLIITERRRLEAQLNKLAADLEAQRAAERRRADELTVLNRIAAVGVEATNIDTLTKRAIAIIGEYPTLAPASATDYFGIGLIDEAAGVLRVCRSTRSVREERLTIPLGQGVLAQVLATGKPWRISDVSREPIYHSVNPEVRSELCVPLQVGPRVIGLINVESKRLDAFSEADERLLLACANELATAIEKARLYAAVELRAEQLRGLREASHTLISDLRLETVLQTLGEIARHMVNAHYAALAVLDADRRLAQFHTAGLTETERQQIGASPQGRGLLGIPLRESVPIRITDLARDPRATGFPAHHPEMKTFLGVPIVAHGKVLGSLYLTDKADDQPFTQEDENLVVGLAADAAIAIENAQLFTEVRRLAITDGLTDLHNRRHFFELAEREFERARRYDHSLSAIMLDIDRFKQVNDTHGHGIGDQVLRVVATRCRENLREIDLLGRYGGEEFAALLPENDLDGARCAAERLRRCVADAPVNTTRGALAITISLGVASLDKGCANLDVLLERADQALYAAKQAGRNRVDVWQIGVGNAS